MDIIAPQRAVALLERFAHHPPSDTDPALLRLLDALDVTEQDTGLRLTTATVVDQDGTPVARLDREDGALHAFDVEGDR